MLDFEGVPEAQEHTEDTGADGPEFRERCPAWLGLRMAKRIIEARVHGGHRLRVEGVIRRNERGEYWAHVVADGTGEDLGKRFVRQLDVGGWVVRVEMP